MSEKRKKKHLVAGILCMLLIGVLYHPAAAAESTPGSSEAAPPQNTGNIRRIHNARYHR